MDIKIGASPYTYTIDTYAQLEYNRGSLAQELHMQEPCQLWQTCDLFVLILPYWCPVAWCHGPLRGCGGALQPVDFIGYVGPVTNHANSVFGKDHANLPVTNRATPCSYKQLLVTCG